MRIIRNPKNNPYWIVITVFLLIFLMVGVLCLQYYKGLQSTIKNESHEYLQEISRQIAGNASRNIQDNFAVLGTISSVLKSSGVKTYEALQPEVLAQQTFWNYKDILLIDGNGNAYDAHGNVVLLSGDEYFPFPGHQRDRVHRLRHPFERPRHQRHSHVRAGRHL